MIYTLLVAHFIADFVCQTDWMAINKSKRWDALALHVLVYTAVISLIVALAIPPSPYPYTSMLQFGYFVGANAAAHFIQDAITSRWTSKLFPYRPIGLGDLPDEVGNVSIGVFAHRGYLVPSERGNRHWFFVVIGLDQLLHYIVLFKTAEWWL